MRIVPSFASLVIIVASMFAANIASNAQSNNVPVVVPVQKPSAPADLSRGTSDIIKLFYAGKKENVLVFYAKFSELEYRLTSKHIAYLQSLGISPNVIAAMLASDNERRNMVFVQKDFETPTFPPAPPSVGSIPAQQPAPVAATQQPIQETVVYPNYSAYPNYYVTFDNSDGPTVRRPIITIGVGVGVGFGDGHYYDGYRGYGGFHGGRHWR